MKNVKQLSIFLTDARNPSTDVEKKELEDRVTFVKEHGFLPMDDTIRFAPVLVEFELQKEISVEEAMNLVHEIENEGRYEVTEFRFCTEYSGFEGEEPPSAGIYLLKN